MRARVREAGIALPGSHTVPREQSGTVVCFGKDVLAATLDIRGCVRSEAMLSGRAAHYVRYPGNTAASCIILVKVIEYVILLNP